MIIINNLATIRNREFNFFTMNPEICYLDSAATAMTFIDAAYAQHKFELTQKANVYRGAYPTSQHATDLYDEARETVAKFIGADPCEIVFVRNATEGLNLAAAIIRRLLGAPMYTMTTVAEHHSNFLPWRWDGVSGSDSTVYVPCEADGTIAVNGLKKAIQSAKSKPDVFAFHHVSNVTGAVVDVKAMAQVAHKNTMFAVCDASQSIPHMRINVKDMDVDMLAFSGHKMCAPMGIGVLYIRRFLGDMCDPVLTGGGMIADWNNRTGATWEPMPYRFEAGTPNVSGALGLAAACKLYDQIGYDAMHEHEAVLMKRLMDGLRKMRKVHVIGKEDPNEHCGVVSFTVDGMDANQVGACLGERNVCVRAGRHCAIPLHDALFGGDATCRASILFYNTEEEIDRFLHALREIVGEEEA